MDFERVMGSVLILLVLVLIPVVAMAGFAAVRLIWRRGTQMATGDLGLAEQVDALRERLDAMEQRGLSSGEVDAQYARLAELEERVDFAERLLAQRNATDGLPPPRQRQPSPPHGSRAS
jgi:hypothetical protein